MCSRIVISGGAVFGSPARAGSVRAAPVFEESSALHTLAVQDLGGAQMLLEACGRTHF